jgi:hypothetical protein
MLFLQKLNQKMAERQLIQPAPLPTKARAPARSCRNAPFQRNPKKSRFWNWPKKNIIFCDNHKRPLYNLDKLRDKYGRTASEEVIGPYVYAEIHKSLSRGGDQSQGPAHPPKVASLRAFQWSR